jgi:hypothetical protein
VAKRTDAERQQAVNDRRAGTSYRDLASRYGVTEGAVRKWVKSAPADPAPPPASLPPPEPPRFELPRDADALTRARLLQERYFALAENAERDGNHTAASRALRDAGAQALLIARLEKGAQQNADLIQMPRAEIDAAIASVRQRLAALGDVPLTCSACGRAMRVQAVKGE